MGFGDWYDPSKRADADWDQACLDHAQEMDMAAYLINFDDDGCNEEDAYYRDLKAQGEDIGAEELERRADAWWTTQS